MGEGDHEKLSLTGKRLETKKSFGASVVQNATIRIKQLKRLATFSRPEVKRLERTKSAVAHALTGLKFISLTDVGAGWCKVEKEFEKLTATTDGYLPRALFAKCI
ncbi:respiratory burst oxidase protein C-like, partial [Trifolium medium]|nr:respiratory burst oxidase protein C-like [Trifolium medium]